MNITVAGSALDRTFDDDQYQRISIELAAFDGEVGESPCPIDDPTAVDEFVSGRQFLVMEQGVVLNDGFIAVRDQTRGPVRVVNRETLYTIQDANALLFARRMARGRPSETDVARVLANAAEDLPGVDTTWVLNSNTATMEAKKYQTDGWGELIDDLVALTGKTLFIHDKAVGGRCLHYHRLTTGHTSALTITDVVGVAASDTTGLVFAPGNPVRTTSGVDLINDIVVYDQAGRRADADDATSQAAHDADGLLHRHYATVEAGSQAELNTIAANMLAELKDERVTYEVDIGPLGQTALANLRVGDYITITSQAIGLTASAQRVAHITLTPFTVDNGAVPELWSAHLELGYPIRLGSSRFKRGQGLPKPPVVAPDPDTGDPDGVGCGFDFSVSLGGFTTYDEVGGDITAAGSAMTLELDAGGGEAASYAARTVANGGPIEVLASVSVPNCSAGAIGLYSSIEIGFYDAAAFTAVPVNRMNGPQGTLFVGDSSADELALGANGPSSVGTSGTLNPTMGQGDTIWMRVTYNGSGITAVAWPSGGDENTDGISFSDTGALAGDVIGIYINLFGADLAGTTGMWSVLSLTITQGCTAVPVGFPGSMYGPIRIGTGDGSTVTFVVPTDVDEGAWAIAVNGVVLTPGRYTFDHATHVVTLSVAPLAGAIITATYRIPQS